MYTLSVTAKDPLVGQTIDGRYRIDAVLGEGGIGRVYRARHLKLDRPVALKVLLEQHLRRGDVKARFEREAQTLAALQHPNIVTITDFGEDNGKLYLVMELVEGKDVDHFLEAGSIDLQRAVIVMLQVLRSLAYAHAEGIVHRDLKPANVLLRQLPDGSDHVEVLDFGLAKFVADEEAEATGPKVTTAGTILGTPAYMAPEQAVAQKVDGRTDVYAAGIMFFELITGRLPFEHQSAVALLGAHLEETPPLLRTLAPKVPVELEALVAKSLAKAPEERFADGTAMLRALEDIVGPTGTGRHSIETLVGFDAGRGDDTGRANLDPTDLGTAPTQRPPSHPGTPNPALAPFAPLLAKLSPQARESAERALNLGWSKGQALWDRRREPKVVGAGVGAVLALFLVGAFAFGGDDEAVVDASPQSPRAEETIAPPIESSELVDPWEAGTPEPLRALKARIDRGARIRRRQLGSIGHYGRNFPDDPRPKLLHGHAYVNQGWLTAALGMYREAIERDSGARGDPRLVENLVRMAGTETLHEEALAEIVRLYEEDGEVVVPFVRAALENPRSAAQQARFEAVLSAL